MGRKAWDEAIKNLLQAVKINPFSHNILLLLARVYYEKGEYEEAFNTARRLIELLPDDPQGLFLAGKCLYQMQKYLYLIDLVKY